MNALLDNAYTRGWTTIGKEVPRPNAVLSISAHWYIPGASGAGDAVLFPITGFDLASLSMRAIIFG